MVENGGAITGNFCQNKCERGQKANADGEDSRAEGLKLRKIRQPRETIRCAIYTFAWESCKVSQALNFSKVAIKKLPKFLVKFGDMSSGGFCVEREQTILTYLVRVLPSSALTDSRVEMDSASLVGILAFLDGHSCFLFCSHSLSV
ncbi:hypothetical protein T01_4804 [Trichinella spiralis]|uniref:Uncharacterized protein n=1 Tax=Trichinella spiralis TaxID=6334 RepID=A0A0V1B2G5_TRISP|nr:hypothetical protein T01_4804 [Trichinella spiralis]